MSEQIKTLADALPEQMRRVRDDLLPLYDAIPTGIFAATLMRQELDRATKAIMEGDTVQMLRSFESLKEFSA